MTEIKKLKWDTCERRGITQKYTGNNTSDIFSSIDGPVDIGHFVSAFYKGNKIEMTIKDKTSENTFIAVITDFIPSDMQYKDLSLDSLVEIDRQYICWIQKKA
ncbi:MAG: hypothetical protein ABFR82_00210 [Nitrospirota bacterium]